MTPSEPIIEAIKQLDNVELGKVRDEVVLEINRRGVSAVPEATVDDLDDEDDDDEWDDDYDWDDYWDDEDFDDEDE